MAANDHSIIRTAVATQLDKSFADVWDRLGPETWFQDKRRIPPAEHILRRARVSEGHGAMCAPLAPIYDFAPKPRRRRWWERLLWWRKPFDPISSRPVVDSLPVFKAPRGGIKYYGQ